MVEPARRNVTDLIVGALTLPMFVPLDHSGFIVMRVVLPGAEEPMDLLISADMADMVCDGLRNAVGRIQKPNSEPLQ